MPFPLQAHLRSVGGDVNIGHNTKLASLHGLNHLAHIGNDLVLTSNSVLSQHGLTGIERIHGSIYVYYATTPVFSGFKNLRSVGKHLIMTSVSNLIDYRGLENLREIGGTLMLASVSGPSAGYIGFGGLERVGGHVVLLDATRIKSLSGLQNLRQVGGCLTILGHPSLSSVSLPSLASVSGNPDTLSTDAEFLLSQEFISWLPAKQSTKGVYFQAPCIYSDPGIVLGRALPPGSFPMAPLGLERLRRIHGKQRVTCGPGERMRYNLQSFWQDTAFKRDAASTSAPELQGDGDQAMRLDEYDPATFIGSGLQAHKGTNDVRHIHLRPGNTQDNKAYHVSGDAGSTGAVCAKCPPETFQNTSGHYRETCFAADQCKIKNMITQVELTPTSNRVNTTRKSCEGGELVKDKDGDYFCIPCRQWRVQNGSPPSQTCEPAMILTTAGCNLNTTQEAAYAAPHAPREPCFTAVVAHANAPFTRHRVRTSTVRRERCRSRRTPVRCDCLVAQIQGYVHHGRRHPD